MDIEHVMAANAVNKGQLDKAIVVVKSLQEEIDKLKEELEISYKKVLYAEQNEANMRSVMVKSITERNAEKQQLLEDMAELKGIIRKLRADK